MITAGDHSLNAPHDVQSDSSQWTGWLQSLHPPSGDSVSIDAVLTWLERVEGQLTLRRQGYREAVTALQARWKGLLAQPTPPPPAELQQVVDGLIRSVEHLSAADALRAMVTLTGELVRCLGMPLTPPPVATHRKGDVSAADALALLEAIGADRTRIASMAAGDLLDILAKIVIAMEDAEQQIGATPEVRHRAFSNIHDEIAKGADELRGRFMMSPTTTAARGLVAAIRECTVAVRGLGVELAIDGPEITSPLSAEALIWTLQELLNELRSSTYERVHVVLATDGNGTTILTVTTPSRAFAVEGAEPAWLLRSRVRMELVDGTVTPRADETSTSVEIRVR